MMGSLFHSFRSSLGAAHLQVAHLALMSIGLVGSRPGVYSELCISKVNEVMFKYDVKGNSTFNATMKEMPHLAQMVEAMKKSGASAEILKDAAVMLLDGQMHEKNPMLAGFVAGFVQHQKKAACGKGMQGTPLATGELEGGRGARWGGEGA